MTHRIISLLPSGTEIVAALGFEELLVGRSHECDFPASVKSLPVCCKPRIDVSGSSGEIDRNVKGSLQAALSIYEIDLDELRRLNPTLVLTQTQCEVCAVSLAEVQASLAEIVGTEAEVLAVAPMALADIWQDIVHIATKIGDQQRGKQLVEKLKAALDSIVLMNATTSNRPTVACIEWMDPLMTAGNWTPELVAMVGGNAVLCDAGKHSPWISWEDIRRVDPDYLIVMPCGFNIERTRQEMALLTMLPDWNSMQAVRTNQVFIADGNQYFNRPGPRVVESAEIIAEILGTTAAKRKHHGIAWQPLSFD